MPAVRVRQHVNPLSQKYQQPITCPDWASVYQNPDLPLHLDIGCARGQFLVEMARCRPDWNYLGVEIRQPLVQQALEIRDALHLRNLHYLFGNINVSLPSLLPPNRLSYVTIQFPDPWFKKRHQKRRVVQPALIEAIATRLKLGCYLFLQSDVLEVAQDMRDTVLNDPAFALCHTEQTWLPINPLPIPTERETLTLSQNQPVYRCLFQRIT